jgi:hypothetical protein
MSIQFVRMAPALAGGLVLAGMAASTRAETLLYEPFNYPDGLILDIPNPATGFNLAGPYTAPSLLERLVVSSPGLTYGNLSGAPAALANRLSDANGTNTGIASAGVAQTITVPAGDELYWSAIFRFDDSLNGNHLANVTLVDGASGDLLRFGQSGAGARAVRVEASTAATGGLVTAGADQSFTDGDTLLLVGRYVNAAGAGGDRLDLIGYDTADADVLPSGFNLTDPNAEFAYTLTGLNVDLTQVTQVRFTVRGNGNNFIDELRVGDTYADVVPEPAATATLLLLGGLLAARRRRGACPRASHAER